jgi:alanine dehydrogenase
MLIGIPMEIKDNEARVALSPLGAKELVKQGHEVLIETGAGWKVGFTDEAYVTAGAKIAASQRETYKQAEMIVKVKEPQPSEIELFQKDQILFSYLHLAAEKELTHALLKKDIVGISYETVECNRGTLPLLTPMSEVAGRLSTQAGAFALQKNNDGQGLLLGGVTGVEPAKVVVIGGGIVGTNAAFIASGMGAEVTILDKSLNRIRELDNIFAGKTSNLYAAQDTLEKKLIDADLVIGAVLIPGAAAPKIVSREMIKSMKDGAVIVDVAIDQGGCFETSKPTSHSNPTYIVDGVIHYCVTNMPAAAAKTASRALENATLPYISKLANLGYKQAFKQDKGFEKGLNVYYDKITYKTIADEFGLEYLDPKDI